MSFGHDPEVPAGFQDADIEMAEMREAANEAYADEQREKRELERMNEHADRGEKYEDD